MKSIEAVEMRVGDIKFGFENPRKIKGKEGKARIESLERSLDTLGDFGVIVIDKNNDVIAGNQRVMVLQKKDPDMKVLCKRLMGYSTAEKKIINVKDNTHVGEWDWDMIADWEADLHIDLGLRASNLDPEERDIENMELIHYERYDYVLIACKTELDYNQLVRKLGIEGKKVKIAKKRKINARAIWYDQIACLLIDKEEMEDKT